MENSKLNRINELAKLAKERELTQGKIVQILFHICIGGVILCRKHTLVISVGIQETLHGIPQLCSLLSHFNDSHRFLPPFKYSF